MKTIKTWILETAQRNCTRRLEKLIEIKAPEIIIERQKEIVEDLNKGLLSVTDKEGVLDNEYVSHELKTGNGGKQYFTLQTNKGVVNYFPNGRFGAFVSTPK